jgi:hypothetical protein
VATSSQDSPFNDHGTQPAARAVNAGRKAGRATANDHKVCLDFPGVAFRDENRLLLHLVEGKHEQFLSLGALGDQDLIGIGLRHALSGVLVGQVRICLDVNEFEG